jgi:predicted CXXCH cytochrome family protein
MSMVKKALMIRMPIQVIGRIVAIALLWVIAGNTLAVAERLSGVICDYSVYLEEPVPRARFIAMRNEMYQLSQARASSDTRYSILSSPAGTTEVQADELSRGCLGCHEEMGMMLKDGSRYPKGGHNEGMVKISVSHSIGIDYERKALFRTDLKSASGFSPNMMLVNGKVGCVTCHDPLSSEVNHLVTNNGRSGICFECHNM